MKSVTKKRQTNKKRAEKPVSEQAGIKSPSPNDLIQVKRGQLEQAIGDLAQAKNSAIEGAIEPKHTGGGPHRAIDAYRQIEYVRKHLSTLIFLGGAQ